MDYAKESLRLHGEWKGKIEVVTRVPAENKDDLSLAYTPGVAQPCLEIQKDVNKSYDLTRRWNMMNLHFHLNCSQSRSLFQLISGYKRMY